MGRVPVIVISTYNPDTKRTTQDEELLTTMLTSFIRHVIRCEGHRVLAATEEDKAYWNDQKTNCNKLIGLTFPLLGLDWEEVHELVLIEREKWQTDLTGKK